MFCICLHVCSHKTQPYRGDGQEEEDNNSQDEEDNNTHDEEEKQSQEIKEQIVAQPQFEEKPSITVEQINKNTQMIN